MVLAVVWVGVGSGCGGSSRVDAVSCGMGWCWLHVFVAVMCQLQLWWQLCAYCHRSGLADLQLCVMGSFMLPIGYFTHLQYDPQLGFEFDPDLMKSRLKLDPKFEPSL